MLGLPIIVSNSDSIQMSKCKQHYYIIIIIISVSVYCIFFFLFVLLLKKKPHNNTTKCQQEYGIYNTLIYINKFLKNEEGKRSESYTQIKWEALAVLISMDS